MRLRCRSCLHGVLVGGPLAHAPAARSPSGSARGEAAKQRGGLCSDTPLSRHGRILPYCKTCECQRGVVRGIDICITPRCRPLCQQALCVRSAKSVCVTRSAAAAFEQNKRCAAPLRRSVGQILRQRVYQKAAMRQVQRRARHRAPKARRSVPGACSPSGLWTLFSCSGSHRYVVMCGAIDASWSHDQVARIVNASVRHVHESCHRRRPLRASDGVLRPFRNGTPRQPLLVPSARAKLTLFAHVPSSCLDGLERFSHCWLIFVFNLNTGAPLQVALCRPHGGLRCVTTRVSAAVTTRVNAACRLECECS